MDEGQIAHAFRQEDECCIANSSRYSPADRSAAPPHPGTVLRDKGGGAESPTSSARRGNTASIRPQVLHVVSDGRGHLAVEGTVYPALLIRASENRTLPHTRKAATEKSQDVVPPGSECLADLPECALAPATQLRQKHRRDAAGQDALARRRSSVSTPPVTITTRNQITKTAYRHAGDSITAAPDRVLPGRATTPIDRACQAQRHTKHEEHRGTEISSGRPGL